jgi:hypothetical protein
VITDATVGTVGVDAPPPPPPPQATRTAAPSANEDKVRKRLIMKSFLKKIDSAQKSHHGNFNTFIFDLFF